VRRAREAQGFLLSLVVFVAAVAYVLTAPRWILGGDNGEFATLYETGGIAHPPGYPAMVLWLRLWHWLPVSSPAHGAALATVALGVLSVWTLQRACLAWGASLGSTLVASTVFAFSPLSWKLGTHAEVFAMNAAIAGAILALSAPDSALSGTRLVVALGFLAGVGLADHQSIALLAPVGLYAAARASSGSPRPARAAALGLLAFVVGFVPFYVYVYALARTSDPQTTHLWIEAPTLAGVWFHIRRGAYGSFTLSSRGVAHPITNELRLLWALLRHTLGMPLAVVLAFVVAMVRRSTTRSDAGSRRLLGYRIALAGAWVLTGPVFVAPFNLPLDGAGPTMAERFYLLPEVVVTLLGALSLDVLVPPLRRTPARAAMAATLVGIGASVQAVPEVREYSRPTTELYLRNALRTAPQDAIVVGGGDHRWGAFLYGRYALHLRPDVDFVMPGLLKQAWYRDILSQHVGISFETTSGHRIVGPRTLMARLLATGRPVLYTDWVDASLEDTRHYTVGALMRVLREDEPEPSAEDVLAMNMQAFSDYEIEASPPEDPRGWGYDLQSSYARAWGELAARFAGRGDLENKQRCLARAATLAPWTVSRSAVP
jgi:hypothetical protein